MSNQYWKTLDERVKIVTAVQKAQVEMRILEWEALFTILEDGIRRLYEQAKQQG